MFKITDFSAYEDLQNYKTYILDNADKLREYLQLKGKWHHVIKHIQNTDDPLFDAASGLIHKVNKEQAVSFNPKTQNGRAHLYMLKAFKSSAAIDDEDETAILAMSTKRPFFDIKEDEYDSAMAELAAQGSTTASILYNSISNNIQPHFVNSGYRSIAFQCVLDTVSAFDSTILITLEVETAKSGFFIEDNTVRIPVFAKKQPKQDIIRNKYTRRIRIKSATIGLLDTAFIVDMVGER